jgi:hypothetical protein
MQIILYFFKKKWGRRRQRPGKIGAVTADTTSLDRPNTSVTKHSHFRQRPISSKRTLNEREHWVDNGSKDWSTLEPVETNLHSEIQSVLSATYIAILLTKQTLLLPLVSYLFLIVVPYMLLNLIARNLLDSSQCFSLNLISLENKCLDFE